MLENSYSFHRCADPNHKRNAIIYERYGPNPILKRSSNVRWLRERSPEKIIEQSVNAYYEKNNQSIIIKPDYIFPESKLNEINKLKELFREFDQDFSSKFF